MLKYRETYGRNDTNDPSAFICSFVNVNTKTIYIFDEHYEKGMSNKDIYN